MEATTAFDLNHAIHNWRSQLAQSPAFRSENLNELESHLRDSISTLQTRGLSPEEAFSVAANRIGKDKTLVTEFAKLNARAVWLDRFLWVLVGAQGWAFVSSVTSTFQTIAFFKLNKGNINFANGLTTSVLVCSLIGALGLALCIGLCWWVIAHKGVGFPSRGNPGQKKLWRLGFASFCVLPIITYAILAQHAESLTTQVMQAKILWPGNFTQTMVTWQYSMFLNFVIQCVGLVALTFFIAGQHLRLNKA